LLKYYISKSTQKQVNLDIFTIFVKNANFYVNAIMSTQATNKESLFIKFNYFQDIGRSKQRKAQHIEMKVFLHDSTSR